jgi:Alpha-L-arabinofuranosidase B (ABFB) domain
MSSWIQSFNFRDRFIRHRNFLAELDPEITGPQRDDYAWDVREIPGQPGHVRIRPHHLPDYALRHKNFRLLIEKPNGSNDAQWKRDTNFVKVEGLAAADWFSYRASNLSPAHYIRHRDFHLYVEPNDNSNLFRQDATFAETYGL